jgi:hypothetical protein
MTATDPDACYRCPNCDAFRDSPTAICDRCDYSPDPIEDREPEASAHRSITIQIRDAAGTAIAFFGLVALFAIGCGGMLVDNRIADRAILRAEANAAAWLGEVIR